MEYQLYHEENLNGGKSHQLGLFPEGSVIEARKFIWLSSVCEDGEDKGEGALKGRSFSIFENHLRNIVIIDGNIILAIGEERAERLGQYAQTQFDGAIRTDSFGSLKGFLLTTKKGTSAEVNIFELKEKYTVKIGNPENFSHGSFLLYCTGGFAIVAIDGKRFPLEKGAQFVLNYSKYEEIEIILLGNGIFIMSEVFYDYDEEEYKKEERIQIAKNEKEAASSLFSRDEGELILQEYNENLSPVKQGFFQEYLFALKIANLFFRGKGLIKIKNQNILYSNILKKRIRIVRNSFLPFFIGIFTLALGLVVTSSTIGSEAYVGVVVSWLITFTLIINPMTYYVFLPKPLWRHIRYTFTLNEDEKSDFGAGEVEENRTERILRKYKNAGKQKYDQ